MTFTLDGVDFSDRIAVTGFRVRPRKVFGSSRGDLLNGGHVADMIVLKKDLDVSFVAMVESDVSTIAQKCTQEYVMLGFSDPISGTDISGKYEPTLNDLEMAIDKDQSLGDTAGTKRYWYGFSVSFEASDGVEPTT